jgi:hypothetical protein
LRKSGLWRAWGTFCVVVALLGALSLLGSCAARQPQPTILEDDTIEEAHPLADDESVADKAGEVGVVGLVVGVIVGGILLPIFLL